MRLNALEIRGYRSLKNVIWEPGALNVVIGPNASGKSNLLRALELLNLSAKGQMERTILEDGGMGAVIHNSEPGGQLQFMLQTPQCYSLTLQRLGGAADYRITDEKLADTDTRREGFNESEYLIRYRNFARFEAHWDGNEAEIENYQEVHESLLSEMSPLYQSELFSLAFKEYLASWTIFQDVHFPRRSPVREARIARAETRLAPDASNLINVLHTRYTGNRQFKADIDDALRAAFGADYQELTFPPDADQRVQLRLRWRSAAHEPGALDLSDGTLQFLYLLTALADPEPAGLIAIDEPENGLHPAMLPIIAEFAVSAARKTQVIFTTHSASLLDAFGAEAPTVTVARWADGETHLDRVDRKKPEGR